MRIELLLVSLLLFIIAYPAEIHAGIFDGFGAGALSLGGGNSSLDNRGFAAYNNPAGLAAHDKPILEVSHLSCATDLKLDGYDAETDEMAGYSIGYASTISRRFGLGLSLYAPQGFTLKTRIRSPAEKRFVLFNDRFSTLQLACGLGAKISEHVQLGLGLRFLAGLSMGIPMSIYVSNYEDPLHNDPDFRYSYVEGEAEIKGKTALVAGCRWQPTSNLTFGAVYRDEVSIPLKGEALVEVEIGGIYHLDIPLFLSGNFLFEPRQAALAMQHQFRDRWLLHLEVIWSDWSQFRDSRLTAKVGPMESNPPYFEEYPAPDFRDTWGGNTGVRWLFSSDLEFALGYRYEPSPAPQPVDSMNLADADRHIMLGYIAYHPEHLFREHFSSWQIDLFSQWHVLERREIKKDDPVTYGDSYTIDGNIVLAGISLEYRL